MAGYAISAWLRLTTILLIVTAAPAQVTERISVGAMWAQANGESHDPALSADGRTVCIVSNASNLVEEDENGTWDVFVGSLGDPASLELVSVDSNGMQANGPSWPASVSSNGQVVVFRSSAGNLEPGVSGLQVYVHDRSTAQTTLASKSSQGVPGNSYSAWNGYLSIAPDGNVVSFSSNSNNLVPGDDNNQTDIFVHDRVSGQTEVVTVSSSGVLGNGLCWDSAHSWDGRYVAFTSAASNLVPGDGNGTNDVFVRDRQTGKTTRESVSSAGVEANNGSGEVFLSDDGRFLAFSSHASNLVPGDSNGKSDIFVRDRTLMTNTRVSLGMGGVEGNGHSFSPTLSSSGRYIAFQSDSDNIVPGDTNLARDFFLLDLANGTIQRVNVDSQGGQASYSGFSGSERFCVSADGRFVSFKSRSSNLVPADSNGQPDSFVRDTRGCPPLRSFFEDGDGDGFGRADSFVLGCTPPVGFVVPGNDCDDSNAAVFPGAAELCNDVDDDCDSIVDDDFIVAYCTAKVNSQGCTPAMEFTGNPAWSGADDFVLTASSVLNLQPGVLIWSKTPAANPFGGGFLCLGGTVVRAGAQSSGGSSPPTIDCSGSYAFHFSQLYMAQNLLAANTTVYSQFWSRDTGFAPSFNMGLTDAIEFTICP